jgi:outer membrane receptor protein involved in Fe transport
MEWSDIQLNSSVGGGAPWWLRGTFNGQTGESKGVEISGEWQATDNLVFQGSAFFNNSEYTADTFTPSGGDYLEDGQEMPNSPDTKYWLAAEYTIPEVFGGDLWFRYDTSYQSETWDNLDAALDNDLEALIPSWKSSNLQIGLSRQTWDVSLMARNIWNDMGINSLINSTYASDYFGDTRFRNERTVQRPRTISLSLRKRF